MKRKKEQLQNSRVMYALVIHANRALLKSARHRITRVESWVENNPSKSLLRLPLTFFRHRRYTRVQYYTATETYILLLYRGWRYPFKYTRVLYKCGKACTVVPMYVPHNVRYGLKAARKNKLKPSGVII